MGIELAVVARCDGFTGRPQACLGKPLLEVDDGRTLCLDCAQIVLGHIATGQEEAAEFSQFDEAKALELAKAAAGEGEGDDNVGICPECKSEGKKSKRLKNLAAHRRRYHGVFVRGPKRVVPGAADMEKLAFEEPGVPSAVATSKPDEDGF